MTIATAQGLLQRLSRVAVGAGSSGGEPSSQAIKDRPLWEACGKSVSDVRGVLGILAARGDALLAVAGTEGGEVEAGAVDVDELEADMRCGLQLDVLQEEVPNPPPMASALLLRCPADANVRRRITRSCWRCAVATWIRRLLPTAEAQSQDLARRCSRAKIAGPRSGVQWSSLEPPNCRRPTLCGCSAELLP